MKKYDLKKGIQELFENHDGNVITSEIAINPDLNGLVIFDSPLIGIASASDSLFHSYKNPEIIGECYMTPEEWLPGALSVISMFFPFTERVRISERKIGTETSQEWLHGRIEGQNFISDFTKKISQWLSDNNIKNCAPSIDERFEIVKCKFLSNWSERHVAYACGLGTFGLSKGIITQKGMAGRLSSIIINKEFEPDERKYLKYDEYCIKCGICIKRCPAHAISFEKGKEHIPCFERLNQTRKKYAPRYGCGKCQTAVPCEFKNPKIQN